MECEISMWHCTVRIYDIASDGYLVGGILLTFCIQEFVFFVSFSLFNEIGESINMNVLITFLLCILDIHNFCQSCFPY